MIGTYSKEDLMQKWFIENLPIARQILRHFKHLNTLLDGFRNYETKCYRKVRNFVMLLCLPSVTGGLKKDSIHKLTVLEDAINLFGIMNWRTRKLNFFKSRLTSEDYIQSLSVATELEVAYNLAQRVGIENVELYPNLEDGISDVSVKINNKMIFLEIGNLGESLPEKKIQQILNASAKYLGQKITDQCYLHLTVDTAELVFDEEGRIQLESSIKKLNSEIDMLALHKLAGFEGYFNINDIATVVFNKELYDRIQQWLDPYTKRLLALINSKKIQEWLNNFDPECLKKVQLIKSIIASSKTSTLLVEIHPHQFFPSKASLAERESYLNHLIRHIETQLNEKQIQPNAPNIILIQGFHWTIFALGEFDPLYKRLQQFFEERKEDHLSGVAIFGTDFNKAFFVNNPYARDPSKLNETDVKILGFSVFY